jgi:hypothetical protein
VLAVPNRADRHWLALFGISAELLPRNQQSPITTCIIRTRQNRGAMKSRAVWFLFFFAIGSCLAGRLAAQDTLLAGRVRGGLTLYEKFEGSASAGDGVLDMNTSLGYDFSGHLGADVGVPVYFVTPPPTSQLLASQSAGLGDAYLDLRFKIRSPLLDFTSMPSSSFPTGSVSNGFSTGQINFNWNNEVERTFGRFTPFLDVDPGNGLNNITNPHTRVIRRSFMTIGDEVQFTGGSDVDLFGPFSVNLDAYDVTPWGPQEILSRILKKGTVTVKGAKHNRYYAVNSVTKGGASLVQDHGYDAALDATLKRFVLLELGYDYSVHYASGTVFFSAAFNVSQMLSRASGH